MKPLAFKRFFQIVKESFILNLFLSLTVFAWIRLIFYEVPFSAEDPLNFVRIITAGWVMILFFRAGFELLVLLISRLQHMRLKPRIKTSWAVGAAMMLLLTVLLYSCEFSTSGVHKNLNTGMLTNYSGLSTTESKIVMNEEVLGHTDIPLGESFIIINENVKGLAVKDGKVSVGCSLLITHKEAGEVLSVADLFEGRDVFDPKEARLLQCTVNTGKPMDWDQAYDVKVKFWDKYGKGTIENKVTIRIIDIP